MPQRIKKTPHGKKCALTPQVIAERANQQLKGKGYIVKLFPIFPSQQTA